jgi:hypothetical protein
MSQVEQIIATRKADAVEEVARGAVLMGASDSVAVRAAVKRLEQLVGSPLAGHHAIAARRIYQEYVTQFRAGLVPASTKERARA